MFAHTKSEQLCTIHITIILLGVENHLIIKGATCGTEMAYPSGAQEFIPCAFSGVSVARSLAFCVMFCRSLFLVLL